MVNELPFADAREIWAGCYALCKPQYPFYTYDWHDNFFRTIGKESGSKILYLPELKTIAPFYTEDNHVFISGGREVSDYCDIVGPEVNKTIAWSQIIAYLQPKFSSLTLYNIPQKSLTLKYFRKTNSEIIEEDTTPILDLPDTFDKYVSGLKRKSRHELLRKIRKFERENPNINICEYNAAEKMDILIKLMKSDQRKAEFLTPLMEQFFRLTSASKILLMQINGKDAAAMWYFISGNSILLYNSGFDESVRSGAGFYLKTQSIRKSIADKLTAYNFLQGNERYKYDLGGKDFLVYTVKTALPTASPAPTASATGKTSGKAG